MCLYGFEIGESSVPPGADLPDYERVEPTYYRSRHKKDQKLWVEFVDRHQNHIPREFYNDVEEAAREDGIWQLVFR